MSSQNTLANPLSHVFSIPGQNELTLSLPSAKSPVSGLVSAISDMADELSSSTSDDERRLGTALRAVSGRLFFISSSLFKPPLSSDTALAGERSAIEAACKGLAAVCASVLEMPRSERSRKSKSYPDGAVSFAIEHALLFDAKLDSVAEAMFSSGAAEGRSLRGKLLEEIFPASSGGDRDERLRELLSVKTELLSLNVELASVPAVFPSDSSPVPAAQVFLPAEQKPVRKGGISLIEITLVLGLAPIILMFAFASYGNISSTQKARAVAHEYVTMTGGMRAFYISQPVVEQQSKSFSEMEAFGFFPKKSDLLSKTGFATIDRLGDVSITYKDVPMEECEFIAKSVAELASLSFRASINDRETYKTPSSPAVDCLRSGNTVVLSQAK